MGCEEVKEDIVAFMCAERLKSALIVTGKLLEAIEDLEGAKRSGGLTVFASFVRAVGNEMRLIANVMVGQDFLGLEKQLSLVEGYVRLAQMEAAREELSRLLSRVTTFSGRAMTALKNSGLL